MDRIRNSSQGARLGATPLQQSAPRTSVRGSLADAPVAKTRERRTPTGLSIDALRAAALRQLGLSREAVGLAAILIGPALSTASTQSINSDQNRTRGERRAVQWQRRARVLGALQGEIGTADLELAMVTGSLSASSSRPVRALPSPLEDAGAILSDVLAAKADGDLIDIPSAAALMGLHVQTVIGAIQDGRLVVVPKGGRLHLLRREVKETQWRGGRQKVARRREALHVRQHGAAPSLVMQALLRWLREQLAIAQEAATRAGIFYRAADDEACDGGSPCLLHKGLARLRASLGRCRSLLLGLRSWSLMQPVALAEEEAAAITLASVLRRRQAQGLLDAPRAAARLGRSQASIALYRQAGLLIGVRVNGRWHYAEEQIESLAHGLEEGQSVSAIVAATGLPAKTIRTMVERGEVGAVSFQPLRVLPRDVLAAARRRRMALLEIWQVAELAQVPQTEVARAIADGALPVVKLTNTRTPRLVPRDAAEAYARQWALFRAAYMPVEDAARALGLGPLRVRRMAAAGILGAQRSRWRQKLWIRREDVERERAERDLQRRGLSELISVDVAGRLLGNRAHVLRLLRAGRLKRAERGLVRRQDVVEYAAKNGYGRPTVGVQEAAALSGLSSARVRALVKSGSVRRYPDPRRRGAGFRVDAAEVCAFAIRERAKKGGGAPQSSGRAARSLVSAV